MTFPGVTMWKLTSRAFQKCGTFPSLEILYRSYGCSKSGQISRFFLSLFSKIVGVTKKKRRPQFFRFRFPIESAGTKVGYFDADSIWSRNFENCGRVFFFERQLFLMTNSKFQTPLTLTSHNSGSKHRSMENHHIFRFVRTSAFTWCSPCRVYEIRMSRKCGKHEKIPFFMFLSVTTVKKSWRPAFGQFWCYRTSPWLILTDITHIFDGY